MIIGKRFKFEAAHHLPKYDGKCKHLHGHTYTLEVEVWSQVDAESGMVIDLHFLSEIVNKIIVGVYDHQNLNDFFVNPTVELMVRDIKDILEHAFPDGVRIESVKLQEGEGGWARV
jgi:6-pyruvoyltetrahydropterin/6-carboxytetrahydropterin synthase